MLSIKNLHLINFRSIIDSKIDFQKGINIITGDNGQGKSTALEALSLLLFNYSSYKLSDYIRWGTEEFQIQSEFELFGKNCNIEMSYSEKGGTSKKLVIEGESQPYLNSDASKKLAEIIDPKLSLASMISFEGEIDLINTEPATRREYLKKIYDLSFQKELDEIDFQLDSLKTKQTEYESLISYLEQKQYEQLKEKDLPFSKTEYLLKVEQEKNINLQLQSIEKQVEKIAELEQEKIKVKNSIEYEKNAVKTLASKIESLKTKEYELRNVGYLENLDSLKLKLRSLDDNDIQDLKLEYESIVLQRPKSFDSTQLNSLQKEYSQYEFRVGQLKNILKSFDFDGATCPTCGNVLTKEHLEEHQKELAILNSEEDKLSEALNVEIKKKEEHDRNEEKNKELISKKESLKTKIEEREKSYLKEKKSLEELIEYEQTKIQENIEKDKRTILEYQEDALQLKSEIESKETFIKKAENEIFIIDKKISDIKIEPKENLQKTLESLQVEVQLYNSTEQENAYIQKRNQEKKEEEEKDKKDLKKNIEEKDKVVSDITINKEIKKILQKDFPNYVLESMLVNIQQSMNDFIEAVYDKPYKISIEESKGSIKVLYGIEESEYRDVKTSSGFEKQLFSFAYKNALNSIQNLKTIILDEADSAASESNSEKFYRILADNVDRYEQLFVISHKAGIVDILRNEYSAKIFKVENGKII